MMPIEIRAAGRNEIRHVLRTTLATEDRSAAQLEAQVTLFLQYAREMGLDATRSWWCLLNGREVGACTCLEMPGRTATLMLPSGRACTMDEEAIRTLVQHVVAEEETRDMRVIQCLLETQDAKNATAVASAGFREIAELLYLEWTAAARGESFGIPEEPARDAWATFGDESRTAFSRLVEQTYVGSLDCPGLTGLRDIDDIIAGHQAAGRFSSHRWQMLIRDGRPAGCILLAENPLQPVLEIAYMGVHPDLRGHGLGRVLLARALEIAHREAFTRVTLAVDACNAPALRLYHGAGFRPTTRRRAMVWSVAASSGVSGT
jgi:mycothiol synthase